MPIFQLIRSSKLEFNRNFKPADELFAASISSVMENKSFVVNTTKLENINDLLAYDCGSWLNNGQHSFHYQLSEDSE